MLLYLPLEPHNWKLEVDLQLAVKEEMIVVVERKVEVEVPKARRKRPDPAAAGTEKPGWTTNGTIGASRAWRTGSSASLTGSEDFFSSFLREQFHVEKYEDDLEIDELTLVTEGRRCLLRPCPPHRLNRREREHPCRPPRCHDDDVRTGC